MNRSTCTTHVRISTSGLLIRSAGLAICAMPATSQTRCFCWGRLFVTCGKKLRSGLETVALILARVGCVYRIV